MSDRILVLGAAGRLGAAIVKEFSDRDVVARTRGALDISDHAAVQRIVADVKPAAVVNCAAFNYVDAAETDPAQAFAVNAFAVRSLARAAEAAGALLVQYGSDFVFDGKTATPYREDASPAPRSSYGLSKLLGDWFALDAPRGYVIRVESLFGAPRGWSGRPGSLDSIIDALEHGRDVRVYTDRVVSPSYVADIARATRHVIDGHAAPGVYHCVNSGFATWRDIAEEAARLLGVPARLIPISMDTQPLSAPRPKFCALDPGKLAAAGFAMPPWTDALQRWLEVRERSGGAIQ